MNKRKILVVDLETTGLDPFTDHIVSVAISVEKGKGFNIVPPFYKSKPKVREFLQPIIPFLEDETIIKVFHNAKFDLKFFHQYGIEIKGEIIDTMILDYLLDPNRKTHGLKEISELHLQYHQISFEEMLNGRIITEVPKEELTKYACEDIDLTLQLCHFLTQKLNQDYGQSN
ncbi:DNA polymerase-1 [Chryseobacterium rhizosphaerae]|uniref:ribonuclease H-like domain-containing protein n=1 Tax=Chryseobacterium rhizosphaerae TaxID=395937 RepID=UPI002854A180|nr:ribonuclease H-like domain-containing protein [Chryseobacterium rhizosphaerae]MDR6546682.1 DNA polymerase-1 [Chryseobacterium rhizosphaerae]MDR6546728.1 DNA polymerase-1 [Chryseobacterium rhizosphaerae]